MKKNIVLSVIAAAFLMSCDSDDSVSNEFTNANGNVAKKLIERVDYAGTTAKSDALSESITFNYNANNKLVSASNGVETTNLAYNDANELQSVSGGGEVLSVSGLYKEPIEIFEAGGSAIEYDEKGNPVKILTEIETGEYNQETGEYVSAEFIAKITYDDAPNPYFYTLEAAGVIEAMDNVDLHFSLKPESTEVLQAKALLPMNNITSIVYEKEDGTEIAKVNVAYEYDEDTYPTSATYTGETIVDEEDSFVYTVSYTYKK